MSSFSFKLYDLPAVFEETEVEFSDRSFAFHFHPVVFGVYYSAVCVADMNRLS